MRLTVFSFLFSLLFVFFIPLFLSLPNLRGDAIAIGHKCHRLPKPIATLRGAVMQFEVKILTATLAVAALCFFCYL